MGIRDSGTILTLSVMGVPFYSARGLTQTLTPIQAVNGNKQNLRRTIGGFLINITPPEFLKYASKITCDDQAPPSFDGIWPGQPITVGCAASLSFPSGGAAQRPVLSGSEVTSNGFVTYQPVLTMVVTSLSQAFNEWQAGNRWELDLEEY